jgi:hypothetical protein
LERTKLGETERLAVLNCRYEEDLSCVLALRLGSYKHWEGYYVARTDTRSVAWAEDLGRLTLVNASKLLEVEKSLIEITRGFESRHRGTRCWLYLSIEAIITEVQTWGKDMPRNCKRTSTSAVVDPYEISGSGGRVGGPVLHVDVVNDGGLGALLKCHSGELLFVAFGFNKFYKAHNDFERDVGRLDVWLTHVPADAPLRDLMEQRISTFPHNINSRCEAKLKIGDSKVVHAEVALRTVLGEETIVCTVQQAQQPVEICSASDESTFAILSPSDVGESASVGEYSE